MEPYRTETVETPAGEYTINLHYDEDASNPLTDWDHPGMAFWVNYGDSRYIETDTLQDADSDAANALRTWVRDGHDQDEVTGRFAKWRAIAGSPWVLVAGSDSSSRSDFYRWYVLVNTAETYMASDGKSYPALPDPVGAAKATMRDYRTWAAGEVCGYVVVDPSGDILDDGSCWGFYTDEDAITEAKDAIEYDAAKRIEVAGLVGAGFVGLI